MAKKAPVILSTNLDDYTDLELQEALTNANGSDITIRLQVDWAWSLQSILGKEWNSEDGMGASSSTTLKVMHSLASVQALHQKNHAFILVVREAVSHTEKNKTRDSEQLLRIFSTPVVQKLVDTNVFTGKVPLQQWEIPAVRMWYEVIHCQEGIIVPVNIHFLKELNKLMNNRKGLVYKRKGLVYSAGMDYSQAVQRHKAHSRVRAAPDGTDLLGGTDVTAENHS